MIYLETSRLQLRDWEETDIRNERGQKRTRLYRTLVCGSQNVAARSRSPIGLSKAVESFSTS